ncbi:MAG: transcription-repair coupling factor [Caldimicrobium thiodismutans]|uniref:Transcription-repair-coupling factor n=1 Tax=Caldimicrobium thiodismutans TaxID=1653476 RepID=A0A2N7PK85_9BACT|nr:MAG: transcription-repair coupling factor [Caldimicrobium thiodismutans]
MKRITNFSGINASFLGYLLAKEYKEELKNYALFVIFPDEEKKRDFYFTYKALSQEKISLYPSLTLPPFSEAYTIDEEEKERIKILWELKELKALIIDIKSFARKTIPQELLKKHYLYLLPGEKIDRESFLQNLILLGYERVGVVRNKGEFTVKGAVIDVFSPQYKNPLRIEFFGNEIINLKFFDPDTQKSLGLAEEGILIPARELFFPEDTKNLYEKILALKEQISPNRLSQLLEYIENKIYLENPEFLLPLFYEDLKLLHENLHPEKVLFILYEKERIFNELEAFWNRILKFSEKAKAREKLLFDEKKLYADLEEIETIFAKYPVVEIKELPFRGTNFKVFEIKNVHLNEGKDRINEAFKFLIENLQEKKEILLFTQDETIRKTIEDGLTLRGYEVPQNLKFYTGEIREGFIYPEQNLILTSETELFGKRLKKGSAEKAKKNGKTYFRRYEDLKPGDFVVHKIHGIGKFQGLQFLKVDGFEGEFLAIEYEGGDKLYLPVTRLSELYPYVGVGDKEPQLDKLGKKTFLKRKKEVEKKLTEVVEEILKLYAERKAIKSFSIPIDNLALAEFEQTFPYEETPDQLTAIEEILEDLSSPKPMERLLVGDVGFGKTEVALRAIFATARAGKQVALLTPTTLLAEQHYRNFKERLEPFGIKVGILSRLRNESDQRETIKKLKEGEILVVIGTHRLLSKDVEFKDLGLLVIDEEHRFGVKQKERLKQLKKKVKVLSLSATPIPRSLQLSLLGIFDLSLIETPPPGRKAIKTVLTTFDPELIKNAIEEELKRGGQIYFVHPRIQGLSGLARFLQKLIPSARIEIVHGQLEETQLENAIYKFLNKEVDLLVCTPIIGSGIDIPSANTIFINRADMFGLADIYQLRGRVGRGTEKAYCYLLVPDFKTLTEGAQKRLKALMQFVELGSGFKLALSDLKIRGAGELLGINQSGHINKVGYELYLELLENTIRTLKGEEVEDWEPEVNLKVPAFIPSSYVPEIEERLGLYRELVLISKVPELEDFKNFLEDKYGKLPVEVENLIKIYQLKLYMKALKIPSIEEKNKLLYFILKDLSLLPKFRRVSNSKDFKILRIHQEKEKATLVLKVDGALLDRALIICESLLS